MYCNCNLCYPVFLFEIVYFMEKDEFLSLVGEWGFYV